MTDFSEAARDALKQVYDPEAGINIVDMGLIYDISAEEGVVRVVMTFTSEACPIGPTLVQAVEEAILGLPGSPSPEVEVTFDPPWHPSMISPDGQFLLGR